VKSIQAVLVACFLAGAVAACKSAKTPGPMSLKAVIDAQLAAKGALRWSKDRRLVMTDFHGTPPANTGQEGAHTEYTIIAGARCNGRSFEYQVAAAVLPAQSWMAPELRTSPTIAAQTLSHEQTHFDLSEVFARKIRRRFAELYDPCGQSETALQAVSDALIKDEAREQVRYDEETNHGRTPTSQSDWDRQVASWLDSLSKYGQ
jgi:hypothetical protein